MCRSREPVRNAIGSPGLFSTAPSVSDLCKELGIERVTLYRYVGPNGELRDYGQRVLAAKTR